MIFFKNKPSQIELYPIITAAFCVCLIISNLLASKTFSFYSIILPCAVVIFPIVYIVGDVLTEIYGFELAKRTILLGFVLNLLAVLAYQIAIFLPGTDITMSNAFNLVLSNTPRLLIASFIISGWILCKCISDESAKGEIYRLSLCKMLNKHIVW